MRAEEFTESKHRHQELVRIPFGRWIVYIDNHSMIRSMTRAVGPRMMTNLITFVSLIPNLEQRVPVGGDFWIKDRETNSAVYFRRLDVPGEPLAVRAETVFKGQPRAGARTPIFTVDAYTEPETPQIQKGMQQAKLISRFVGPNVMANTLARNVQKGALSGQEVITRPETQDSKRYDRAFSQAKKK